MGNRMQHWVFYVIIVFLYWQGHVFAGAARGELTTSFNPTAAFAGLVLTIIGDLRITGSSENPRIRNRGKVPFKGVLLNTLFLSSLLLASTIILPDVLPRMTYRWICIFVSIWDQLISAGYLVFLWIDHLGTR